LLLAQSSCSIPIYIILLCPFSTHLVLTSRRLTRLKLVQIPSTDGQASLVVIHALAELVDVVRACARALHLRDGAVGRLVLRGELGGCGGRGFGGRGAAATEPAADCVADGGSDCYTAGRVLVIDHHLMPCQSRNWRGDMDEV
jgi:hypothetical protein